MGNLPSAKQSPRIVNGVIKWYQGDTFKLEIEIELEDQDGEPVEIKDTDTVDIIFLDKRKKHIRRFFFENITDNIVSLEFDDAITALFDKGEYTYDVYYTGENRVTIANDNKVTVE